MNSGLTDKSLRVSDYYTHLLCCPKHYNQYNLYLHFEKGLSDQIDNTETADRETRTIIV